MEEGTEELRKEASHWSLNGDKKLLDLLQNVHQKIIEKCEETNLSLEKMVTALDDASIHLQNVNNKFTALSNSQFIESRVYDDDFTETVDIEKPKEQLTKPESELEAIKQSLLVLEQMHETVTILCDSDSESASDEDGDIARLVLKPKDLYASRPLPYIIGSQQWKNKWHAGLIQEDSESDESISKHPREEFSDSEPEQTDSLRHLPPRRSPTISSSSLESKTQSVYRDSSVEYPPRATQADIAAALARTLAGNTTKPPPAVEEHDEPEKVVRKLYRPHQSAPGTYFSDEPPPLETDQSEESDQDIFAEIYKNQPYSHGDKDRISVADDLFGKPIFDEVPPPPVVIKNPTTYREDVLRQRDDTSHMKERDKIPTEDVGTKKPIGGKSIFGSNANSESIGAAILKRKSRQSSSSGEDSDVPPIDKSANIYNNKQNKEKIIDKKENLSKDIRNESQIVKERDIFDELFAKSERANKELNQSKKETIKESPKQAQRTEKKIDLFNDNIFDDIDDIFATNVKTTDNNKNTMIKNDKKPSKSIFEDDDDLFSDIAVTNIPTKKFDDKKHKESIFESDDELFSDKKIETIPSINKSNNILINKKEDSIKVDKKSIFESDDDLFTEKPKEQKVTKENKVTASVIENKIRAQVKEDEGGSIFDSDDDIFSDKPIKKEVKSMKEDKPENQIIQESKTLFDDTDNDIFSNVSQTKTAEIKNFEDDNIFSNKTPISENKLNTNLQTKVLEKYPDFLNNDLYLSSKGPAYENVNINSESANKKGTQTDDKAKTIKGDNPVSFVNDSKPAVLNQNVIDDELDNDLFSKSFKTTRDIVNKTNLKNEDSDLFVTREIENSQLPKVPVVDTKVTISEHTVNDNSKTVSHKTIIDTQIAITQNVVDDSVNPLNENKYVSKPGIAVKPTNVQVVNIHTEIAQTKYDESEIMINKEVEIQKDSFTDNTVSNLKLREPKPKANEDILSDIFQDQPPDFEKPKEPKKSRNVNALFDDDSDDESMFFKKNDVITDERPEGFSNTDDRLFGLFRDEPPAIDVDFIQKPINNKIDPPTKRDIDQNVTKKVPAQRESGLTADIFEENDDDLFTTQNIFDKSRKKIILSDVSSNTSNTSSDLKESFKEDNLKDLKTSRTNVNKDLEKLQRDNSKTENLDSVDNPLVETKKIGKLKPMNFNINVNTLLPGASPKKSVKKDETIDNHDITPSILQIEEKNSDELDISQNIDSKLVRSVSFEGEPDPAILDNKLSKERPKIQVKRRPSTRRARREAVKKSGIDFGEDSTDNPAAIDDNIEQKEETNSVKHKKIESYDCNSNVDNAPNYQADIFNEKDLFTSHEILSQKDGDTSSAITNNKAIIITNNTQDDVPKAMDARETKGAQNVINEDKPESRLTVKSVQENDLFQNEQKTDISESNLTKDIDKIKASITPKIGSGDVKSKVVYVLNDEDIFQTKPETKLEKQNVTSSNTKSIFDNNDNDDIFKTIPVEKEKSVEKEIKTEPNIVPKKDINKSLNLSDSEEELFGTTKTSKPTHSNVKILSDSEDENLFKNTVKTVTNIKTLSSVKDTTLFDSDEELFKKSKKVDSVKKTALFGSDSDEDLFGGKRKEKEMEVVVEKKNVDTGRKGSLFGDQSDEEDLFGAKKKLTDPKQQTPSLRAVPKEQDSKPVTSDPLSLFGNDE